MAIFHLQVHTKNSDNIADTAAYNSGDKIKNFDGKISSYPRKEEFVYSKILLPKGCSRKFEEREYLWNTVRRNEIRKNAQVAKSIIVALPKELNSEQQIFLLESFCKICFCFQGFITDYSIHYDNIKNPHAHILIPVRVINKEGLLGDKKIGFDKKILKEWRREWQDLSNFFLDKYANGVDHISCKSNKERGIGTPTVHIGQKRWRLKNDGNNKIIDKVNDDCFDKISSLLSPKI